MWTKHMLEMTRQPDQTPAPQALLDSANRWFHLKLSQEVSFSRDRVGGALGSYVYIKRQGEEQTRCKFWWDWQEIGSRKRSRMSLFFDFCHVNAGTWFMFQSGIFVPFQKKKHDVQSLNERRPNLKWWRKAPKTKQKCGFNVCFSVFFCL